MLSKPKDIKENEKLSQKWDEITQGRSFKERDIPVLKSLCYWYLIQDQCMSDLSNGIGGVDVSFVNEVGDEKAKPQLGSMKQASAEIRALNKQLGIDDSADDNKKVTKTGFKAIRGRLDGSKNKDSRATSRKSVS